MADPDRWKQGGISPGDPAWGKVDIDVSGGDQTLDPPARAVRCKPSSGTAGVVAFTDMSGDDQTTEIAVGELLPIGALAILSSGTTAGGLEALF